MDAIKRALRKIPRLLSSTLSYNVYTSTTVTMTTIPDCDWLTGVFTGLEPLKKKNRPGYNYIRLQLM